MSRGCHWHIYCDSRLWQTSLLQKPQQRVHRHDWTADKISPHRVKHKYSTVDACIEKAAPQCQYSPDTQTCASQDPPRWQQGWESLLWTKIFTVWRFPKRKWEKALWQPVDHRGSCWRGATNKQVITSRQKSPHSVLVNKHVHCLNYYLYSIHVFSLLWVFFFSDSKALCIFALNSATLLWQGKMLAVKRVHYESSQSHYFF